MMRSAQVNEQLDFDSGGIAEGRKASARSLGGLESLMPDPLMLWLVKRRYMNHDLLADRFGRYFEIPKRLSQYGRVKILCLDYRNRQRTLERLSETFEIESFPVSRLPGLMAEARRLLRSAEGATVVGGSDSLYGIMAAVVAARGRARFIYDVYDDYDTFASARLPFVKHLSYLGARRADHVVLFDDRLGEKFREKYVSSIGVVQSGIDGNLFFPRNQDSCRQALCLPAHGKVIGYFGAISAGRNMEDIFSAFEAVRHTDSGALLLLAGTLDPGVSLPSDGVRYLGQVQHSQVPVLIGACDALTSTVRHDESADISFPLKVKEYIACRRPFVTPARGGAARYLAEYPEYLFEVGRPDMLADRLAAIFRATDFRFPPVMTWDQAAESFARQAGWPHAPECV